MSLHESTFAYLKPSDDQKKTMELFRKEFRSFVNFIDGALPDGPDKTYVIRKLRECGMWVNVAVTRLADGTPREGAEYE